jgi:hypothetical protein
MSRPHTVSATDGMRRGFGRVNGSVDEDSESIGCKLTLEMTEAAGSWSKSIGLPRVGDKCPGTDSLKTTS